jgi:hypothetical protein
MYIDIARLVIINTKNGNSVEITSSLVVISEIVGV